MVHAERAAWTEKGYRTPIQGNPGWPDLVLAHPVKGKFLVLELKSATGKTSPEQKAWLAALRNCGIEARLFWPEHWDLIEKLLD